MKSKKIFVLLIFLSVLALANSKANLEVDETRHSKQKGRKSNKNARNHKISLGKSLQNVQNTKEKKDFSIKNNKVNVTLNEKNNKANSTVNAKNVKENIKNIRLEKTNKTSVGKEKTNKTVAKTNESLAKTAKSNKNMAKTNETIAKTSKNTVKNNETMANAIKNTVKTNETMAKTNKNTAKTNETNKNTAKTNETSAKTNKNTVKTNETKAKTNETKEKTNKTVDKKSEKSNKNNRFSEKSNKTNVKKVEKTNKTVSKVKLNATNNNKKTATKTEKKTNILNNNITVANITRFSDLKTTTKFEKTKLWNGFSDENFEDVRYVEKLSKYAINDYVNKSNPGVKRNNLIGKKIYMENNLTFDDTPQIYHDIVTTSLTDIWTPHNPDTKSEDHSNLWKGDNNRRYHDGKELGVETEVGLNGDLIEYEHVVKSRPVRIQLQRKLRTQPQMDEMLAHSSNPLQERKFEAEKNTKYIYNKNIVEEVDHHHDIHFPQQDHVVHNPENLYDFHTKKKK